MADFVFEVADDAEFPALVPTLCVGFDEPIHFILHFLLTYDGSLVFDEDMTVFEDHISVWSVGFTDVWLNLEGDRLTKLKVDVRESQEMLQL